MDNISNNNKIIKAASSIYRGSRS